MSRIPLVEESQRPDLAPLIEKIKAQRGGRFLNLYRTLAHSPTVCEGWLGLFTAIRQKAKLDGASRELAIMRVAVVNGAEYEYRAHMPFALKEGLTQQQIDDLPSWTVSDAYPPKLRAVLAYTDAMTKEIRVPDAVFAAVRAHFDERETVELTATIGGYNLVSRFLEAVQMPHETGELKAHN
ncbi:MAG: carboxymuconolactone decarboxylase family protein [Burkholderiales bacterium]|nr:carboxymuconolactone decarboxylase family protein [Burkholderiales bacterium]